MNDPDCALRRELDEIASEEEARVICAECRKFKTCDCRIDNGDRADDKPVARSCNICSRAKKAGKASRCGVQPYTITFGRDYTAPCPICNGLLKPVQANTFETFILGRYEHDHSFAQNFLREMNNTLDIKKILRFR